MNKLSDNEIQSIRDTLASLFVGDQMVTQCRAELIEPVLELIEQTGKELNYRLYVTATDRLITMRVG